MATRHSIEGLRRVVTSSGLRWYDPSIGQYVRLEIPRPSKEELEQKLDEFMRIEGWEKGGAVTRYRPKRRRFGRRLRDVKPVNPDVAKARKFVVPDGHMVLERDVADRFCRGLRIICEFVRHCRGPLKILDKAISPDRFMADRYLMATSITELGKKGVEIVKEIDKRSNNVEALIEWHEDRGVLPIEALGWTCDQILLMRRFIENVVILKDQVKSRKKPLKGFFAEGVKVWGLAGDIVRLVQPFLEDARMRDRMDGGFGRVGGLHGAA